MKHQPNIILVLLILITVSCVPQKSLVSFKEEGLTGFMTTSGKVVIQPVYESTLRNFYNGYIAVKRDGKWGAINERGKLVVDHRFDNPIEFSRDGYARTCLNGQYGLIDTKGKTVMPFVWDEVWYKPRDACAAVKKNGKWGFTDVHGNIIIPLEYDDVRHWDGWNNGWMAVCKDRKWGFIDMQNNIVIPLEYYDVRNFSEGLAFVAEKFWEWGCIDSMGNTIIPFTYELMSRPEPRFINGIALVRQNRKYGYINNQNEVVIPFLYDRLNRFASGYAYAEINGVAGGTPGSSKSKLYGYIDTAGREFMEPWVSYKNHDWQITPAPKEIPDFSCLLVKKRPPSQDYDHDFHMYVVSRDPDSLNEETTDTLWFKYHETDSLLYLSTRPPKKPEPPIERYTLEEILSLSLTAFVEEPISYPDLHRITRVCISYGLMIGGGNYSYNLMEQKHGKWEIFRKETLFKILASENLRKVTWDWIAPFYKKAFQTLHPFHQKIYKEIAAHLREYINTYDRKKMEHYLKYHENRFAHYDPDGTPNPYRKINALTDRLILVHKVITIEEAKEWINRIADEIERW